ncbi:hypothetical protein AB0M87_04425 [Streptomyces sp. NPDC051320]|uniref:hypothetical protein n=1 Tax=Streptomyces sp. NPDC051320 TaxID=3154644 RepID=UPI003444E237
MSTVRLRHPDIEGRVIDVDARSVPHYRSSGWTYVNPADDPNAPAEAEPETTAAPAAQKRRSAATKESE